MAHIHAYLSLGDQCREAMEFYRQHLGGELTVMTAGQSPIAEHFPPDAADQILHAQLLSGPLVLAASGCSPEAIVPGNNVSLSLKCDNYADAQRISAAFAEGGRVFCPLGDAFWGGSFGGVVDRYGVHWLILTDERAAA